MLASRVMRCEVEDVIIKRQEVEEEKVVKCFRYWGEEHYMLQW